VRSGASAHRAAPRAARRVAPRRLLFLCRASECLGTSRGSSSTTSPTSRVRVPRHVVRLVTWLIVDYFAYVVRSGASARRATCHRPRAISPLDFSSVGRTGSHRASAHYVSRRDYSSFGLHRLYCAYAVHPDASSRRSTSHQSVALALAVCPVIPLCIVTTRLAVATDILRLRCASGCLGTSRGSSSTTSTTPCVRVPRHVAWLVTRPVAPLVVDFFAYTVHLGASACRAARCRLLRLRRASGCLGTSRGSSRSSSRRSSSTTSTTLRIRVPRHVARLVVDYFAYVVRSGASARRAARHRPHAVSPLDFSSVGRTGSRLASGHCVSRRDYSSSGLHRLYCAYVVHPDAPSRRSTSCQSVALALAVCPVIPLCVVTTRLAVATDILCLRCVSGCLSTSRGSSSTTSTTLRVRVPQHIARLDAARHAARRAAHHRLHRLHRASACLSTSRGSSRGSSRRSSSTSSPTPRVRVPRHVARLVVDNFDYAARPGALARRATRRLLRLRCASGCLSTLHGSSSTTSTTSCVRVPRHVARLVTRLVAPLVVDYFDYAARPGASACCAARHAARRAARHQLHRLHHASGCLGTSHGSSRSSLRRSSSTSSPTPCVRVPRHIVRLVVDYFTYAARPGASARRTARHAAHRRLLRAPRHRLAATLALLQPHLVSRLLVMRQHWLSLEYAAHCRDVVFRSHRVDHSFQLVFQTSREQQSRPQQLVGINSD
jgi:hypothetical protein